MNEHPVTEPTNVVAFRFLQDIAKDLASGDVSFPTFSAATVAVRSVLDDPNVDADKITRVISREPLLSAKLVRLANSVALNPAGKPIADVRSAVVRVGQTNVRAVAVAVAYEQLRADRELKRLGDRAEKAWRHSVQVASRAYVLASKLTRLSPDEALFAGLVHDIGYFYLLARAPKYPELEGHAQTLDAILREWHPSIGQAVLHAFHLPEAVMTAIAEHETAPPRMPPRTMAEVVRLATLSANATNPARDPDAPIAAIDDLELDEIIAASRDQLASLESALR